MLDRGMRHWPASNELSRNLDRQRNLEDYVRLCLRPEHPMATCAILERRVDRLVWLEVSDAVLHWRATLFSSDNATSNRAIINRDWRTAYKSESNQAEVLVEGSLNVRWIIFPVENQLVFDDDIPF